MSRKKKREIGIKHKMAPIEKYESGATKDSEKELEKLVEIFSAGSSMDAIRIFCAAKRGIWNSTETIAELDLTQKRYYTHLKRLMESELIQKEDGAYRHTVLGNICYFLSGTLCKILNQGDRLKLLTKLARAKAITQEEKEKLFHVLLKNIDPTISKLLMSINNDYR